MTNFHYNPDVLLWDHIIRAQQMSNDPVRQVGAALFVDGKLYLGANGVSPEVAEKLDWQDRTLVRAVVRHAETTSILSALQAGVTREDFQHAVLVVSLQPCATCSALIKHLGISEVIYGEYYVPSDSGKSPTQPRQSDTLD